MSGIRLRSAVFPLISLPPPPGRAPVSFIFSRTRQGSRAVLSCSLRQQCPVHLLFHIIPPLPAKIFPLICRALAPWPISLIQSLSVSIFKLRPHLSLLP